MDQKTLLNKVKMVRVRLEGVLKPELFQEIVEIERALELEIKPKQKQKQPSLSSEEIARAIAAKKLRWEKSAQRAREKEEKKR